MKAITLRNVPAAVEKAIRAKARQKRISVNKAVLELLQERVGILENQKKTRYRDLDALAGSWSAAEGKAFEKAVGAARRIDEDLW
ncbi:MAG TPA: hypothetical protein VGS96_05625 [Thermoanaerobaculia bacterium]|jgi:hypothetical protein|nr:hypothetical protein [Thermoanaerobaculia bacterium]